MSKVVLPSVKFLLVLLLVYDSNSLCSFICVFFSYFFFFPFSSSCETGKVCDAVEVSGRNVMSTSSTVTTELVSHR